MGGDQAEEAARRVSARVTIDELKALVRSVPDFPAPGVLFRDITTLISHGEGLKAAVGHLADRARAGGAQAIAGMEARGFIFGAAVAIELGLGFVPVRKPGKLPVPTIGIDYDLEYGTDRLEIDPTAISPGPDATAGKTKPSAPAAATDTAATPVICEIT